MFTILCVCVYVYVCVCVCVYAMPQTQDMTTHLITEHRHSAAL